MTDTGIFSTSARPGVERMRYAEACLKQGMSYQGAALASGLCVTDLQAALPDYGAGPRSTPEVNPQSPVIQCATALATAAPDEVARIAAMALGLLGDFKGASEVRKVYDNVSLALIAKGKGSTPREQIMRMIDAVAAQYGLTRHDIIAKGRTKAVAHARQHVMWALKANTALSLPAIGKLLGGRDHTTIMFGIRAHEARMTEAAQ